MIANGNKLHIKYV